MSDLVIGIGILIFAIISGIYICSGPPADGRDN